VLDAALTVGQPNEARITALYADADARDIPAAYVGDSGIYLSPELWESLELRIAEQRNAARQQFDEWQKRTGLRDAVKQTAGPSALLRIEIGTAPKLLGEHGPVADLIVASMPGPAETGKSMTLEAALFDTGRPVLAIPQAGSIDLDRTAPIAIAWNGRPEAARALKAALPLLSRSRGEVIVLNAGKREDPEKLAPVADYLAMHGIAARGLHLLDRPGGTGALLLDEVAKRGAGLLVMGAYTHSRLRELVMGGVTHHVVKHAALPVLFAH
jgi:nucleotide-binding universal stress UspA family protein